MGYDIFFILVGCFLILISRIFAKLINTKYESKKLEIGVRTLTTLMGLLTILLSVLELFGVLEGFGRDVPKEESYIVIAIGSLSILLSPVLVTIFTGKFPNNQFVKILGKTWMYIYFIGIGIIGLTWGILVLVDLI